MTRFDTLRLLLAAEVADDLPSVEATMTEISRRMDTLDRGSDAYAAAHRRLNELLAQREQLEVLSSPGLADRLGDDLG